MPILSFPGAALAGMTVRDIVTSGEKQALAQRVIHERFLTPVVMSAMDLSVEAEEFGADVMFSDTEVPTVVGRLLTDRAGVDALPVPGLGSRRTAVYLDAVRRLTTFPDRPVVAGGMIGPLSLAGRLYGVSEALMETAADPELMLALVEKATIFLDMYAGALRDAGADIVIIAEPTAGLLSPAAAARFSSPFIRRIVKKNRSEEFEIVLHNCGARLAHFPATLEAGARVYHFGKPMDLSAALNRAEGGTILCGNLDPSEVFVSSDPGEIRTRTEALLAAVSGKRNFVPSSGCDIPPATPVGHLEAFFEAIHAWTA
jgi:uroporphyrinogen decarboxylase